VQPNKTVAKKTLARLEESVAMGTWRQLKAELLHEPNKRESQYTIASLAKIYLEHCKATDGRPDFKEQALSAIIRLVGNVKLEAFSVKHLDRFVETRVKSDRVRPATVNRGLSVLSSMFSFARKRGYLEANPVQGYERMQEQERALRIIEVSQYRSLVDAVAQHDLAVGAMTAVVGETGIRKSEALRLEWPHINKSQCQLTVVKSKSGRIRYVPLTAYALEWLSRLPQVINCPHVFVRFTSGRVWKDPRGPFERGRDDCGLGWVRGFHDLRHFRATQWLLNGMDIRTVQELLGHSDISTTMRYVHYIQEHAQEAVQEAHEREVRKITGR
jgi:integrase